MNLENKNVILIGASGGIGLKVAELLLSAGARVSMVARSADSLTQLNQENNENSLIILADITSHSGRKKIINQAIDAFGSIDILINLAGQMSFSEFQNEKDSVTKSLFDTNVVAPMLISKLILPHMKANEKGLIVNVGSIFGSIPFALFSTYSSTKAALKAFSESLRRELSDTNINVSYIAPRAVQTKFNSQKINDMCNEFSIKMDDPAEVARQIINTIKQEKKDKYLGFPEKVFVRINALFPRLVDLALKKQNQQSKKFTN